MVPPDPNTHLSNSRFALVVIIYPDYNLAVFHVDESPTHLAARLPCKELYLGDRSCATGTNLGPRKIRSRSCCTTVPEPSRLEGTSDIRLTSNKQ